MTTLGGARRRRSAPAGTDVMLSAAATTLAFLLLLLVAAALRTNGAPNEARTAMAEKMTETPHGWRAVGYAHPQSKISLLFALKHSDTQLRELEATATEIATPGSPRFRQYRSKVQIEEQFAPPVEAQETVVTFLQEALQLPASAVSVSPNIPSSSWSGEPMQAKSPRISVPAPGWVRVEGVTVQQASELLHTEFKVYERRNQTSTSPLPSQTVHPVDHFSSSAVIRASEGYSLPMNVAVHVDFVGGVTKLPSRHFEADSYVVDSAGTADRSYVVTTRWLRQRYNIPANASGSNSPENRQVVPQFLEQYFNSSDLRTYLEQNRRPVNQPVRVVGMNLEEMPGGEASLDVQLIMGMAPNIQTEVWSFSGRRDNTQPPSNFNQEPFLDWLVLLSSTSDPPLVHSVSYADDEKDFVGNERYMDRVNVEFQKAAARGVSIMFAAGDDGMGSVDVRTGKQCTRANPTFPSSSPWITSVGGTQLAPSSLRDILRNSSREEVTCDSKTGCVVTTGGGFSWRYARPAYQTAAVESYLSRSASAGAADSPALTPPLDGSWFNTSGRGYPDISVAATNFEIFLAGRATQIGGTSASSPTVAAMVSLWNEKLRLEGKPPMGFLNPWLYNLLSTRGSTVFRDVTSGNNACSQVALLCCPYGFHATEGWDAVTGVGVPNFQEMEKYLE